MKIFSNSPNFYGYKNIIYDNLESNQDKFTFFSMELNDKDGFKDLSTFNDLQDILAKHKKNPDKKISTLYCLYTKLCGQERLIINDTLLNSGKELKLLSKTLPEEDYTILEKFNLKAYTLLASITRRMMQNELTDGDSGIAFVFRDTYNMMTKELEDAFKAYKLLHSALYSNASIPKIGSIINQNIHKAMHKFFV